MKYLFGIVIAVLCVVAVLLVQLSLKLDELPRNIKIPSPAYPHSPQSPSADQIAKALVRQLATAPTFLIRERASSQTVTPVAGLHQVTFRILRKDAYATDLEITASSGVLIETSDIQHEGDEDKLQAIFTSTDEHFPDQWSFSIHYTDWHGVSKQNDYAVEYHPEGTSGSKIVVKALQHS